MVSQGVKGKEKAKSRKVIQGRDKERKKQTLYEHPQFCHIALNFCIHVKQSCE